MAQYADVLLGNLAYNNAHTGAAQPETGIPRREREYDRPQDRPSAKPREKVHLKTADKPKTRQTLPLFAIAGTAIVAFFMIQLLISYVSLTQLSNESAELEQSIIALKDKQSKLEIQYESTFNLEQVEKYAMAELGMVKAGNEQKVYMNSQLDDKAVILSGEKSAVSDRIKAFFGSILAYLK